MKILLSWSSGKDRAWSLHLLNQAHPGAVAALLTTVNADVSRVAMHGVRQDVLEAQARATGLPLRVVPIPSARASPASTRACFRRTAATGEIVTRDPFTWCDLLPKMGSEVI